MNDIAGRGVQRIEEWTARLMRFRDSRRAWRIGAATLAAIVLYGLAGFVGVPYIARHVGLPRASAALKHD